MSNTSQNGATGTNVPAPQNQKLSTNRVFDDQIALQVMNYINDRSKDGALVLPSGYIAENAITAAKLHLFELKDKENKLIIDQVTVPSVVNAMTKMVTNGWNISKKQCCFIKYGNQLTCQPEYFGNLMTAKRDADVKEVNGQCVYQGDEFVYEVNTETGRKRLVKHVPKLDNQDITKIKGAYAVVVYNDNTTKLEIMTIAQIKDAWNQGAAKGKSGAHTNFTDQMAIKTVCNRAVKIDIGTSDDSEILGDNDPPLAARKKDIAEKGSKKELNIQDTAFEEVSKGSNPSSQEEHHEQPAENLSGPKEPGY